MIKHTQGEWRLFNPVIAGLKDSKYFFIEAGNGFYSERDDEGFHVSAHLIRGDAVLLANAKKMYEALLKITQSDHESDLMESCNIADNLLEEMEAQANEGS
jgi:hypothetical protein